MENKRKITHEGELNLNGLIMPCYITEDGNRIISGRGMQNVLNLVAQTEKEEQKSGSELTRFLKSKWFTGLITSDLNLEHFEPVICYKGNQKINGFESTVLVDFCDIILQARKSGIPFTERQSLIAEQCEILVRSFAKVGIIALVDKATGYQYDRERFELQKILSAYISDEVLKWQLTFTDDFYKEVYRLWDLPFIPKYIKNKPSFIGNITRTYVYDQLPGGVVDVIKAKTGKTEAGNWKFKWHQSLTPEIGREHLKKQITEVTALMSISDTKAQFISFFRKKYGKDDNGQMILDFPADDDVPGGVKKLSKFNQDLTRALNYKPKD